MAGSTIGNKFTITTWGESHGKEEDDGSKGNTDGRRTGHPYIRAVSRHPEAADPHRRRAGPGAGDPLAGGAGVYGSDPDGVVSA